jgi:uncharacterized protein (DUF58 family)
MRRLLAGTWRRAVRLVARFVKPPRTIRFTRDGVKFVAVALAIGVAAINTGNNLLYLVLAMMLSFIILSGLLSEVTLRGVSATRELPATAVAERPVVIRIGLTNEKRWAPSFSLAVHDLIGQPAGRPPSGRRGKPTAEPRTYFLKVSPGETSWRRYTCTFPRRGRVRFGGYRLVTRYPFGLFVKSSQLEGPGELIVLPPAEPVLAPGPGESRSAGDRSVEHRGTGTTPSGLREYRPGDEPRAVHWRRSAALDNLVVREFDRDDRDRVCIGLASRFPAACLARPHFDERFEAAVRRAASLAVDFLERGYEVELRTGDGRVPLGTGPRQRQAILTALALVEPGLAARTAARGDRLAPESRTVAWAARPAPDSEAPVPPPAPGTLPVLVTPDAALHATADLARYRRIEVPT